MAELIPKTGATTREIAESINPIITQVAEQQLAINRLLQGIDRLQNEIDILKAAAQ